MLANLATYLIESSITHGPGPPWQLPARHGSCIGHRTDPALTLLIEVWPELWDTVKNRILRLAEATVRAGR